MEQKRKIQNRIDELRDKLNKEQDRLLDAKINNEYFEKKKAQIQDFIKECEDELKKINEKISRI